MSSSGGSAASFWLICTVMMILTPKNTTRSIITFRNANADKKKGKATHVEFARDFGSKNPARARNTELSVSKVLHLSVIPLRRASASLRLFLASTRRTSRLSLDDSVSASYFRASLNISPFTSSQVTSVA